MSIFKREPRAVYRVYDEEEYLAGDRWPGEAVDVPESSSPVDARDAMAADSPYVDRRPVDDLPGARLRRIAGLALLGSVTTIVAVLIAAYAAHRRPSASPKHGERAGAPARSLSNPGGAATASTALGVATARAGSAHSKSSSRRRAASRVRPVARPVTRRNLHELLPSRLKLPATPPPALKASFSSAPRSTSHTDAQAEFGFER